MVLIHKSGALARMRQSSWRGRRADRRMRRGADGYPVGVARQIGENGLWTAEGTFGVRNPFGATQRRKMGSKRVGISEPSEVVASTSLHRARRFAELRQFGAPLGQWCDCIKNRSDAITQRAFA